MGEPGAPFAAPTDTEKVYRVVRTGDRWLPVKQIPNNLPQQLTSFVGRGRELDEVKGLLLHSGLLTLVGMGGLGKTRLSLQVAAEVMAEYPDGVWFLDLAPMRDPALVTSEAARVLGVREEPDKPLLRTLCAHLKAHRMLLILDNCEHLVEASAQLADAILRDAAPVRILASSREALRVPGEQHYPVLPLRVPKRGEGIGARSRSDAGAVRRCAALCRSCEGRTTGIQGDRPKRGGRRAGSVSDWMAFRWPSSSRRRACKRCRWRTLRRT